MVECTFARLRDVLLGLGFKTQEASGSVVFEPAAAQARIILEPFADEEAVDPATLAVVRRNLGERGILARGQFEELLRQRSLAG